MDAPVFDFLNRQQIYVERLKNWYGADFNRYLKLMADGVRAEMSRLKITTLGELTKAQFGQMSRRVLMRIKKALEGFSDEFSLAVKRFLFADTRMQTTSFKRLLPKLDLSDISPSYIWTQAKNNIVPAFGRTTTDQLTDLRQIAQSKVNVRLNTGFADNENAADVMNDIVDYTSTTKPTVLKMVGNMARGLMATAMQHATTAVTDVIGSLAYDCYQWCSVIDSVTTKVCIERNGNVYRYGEGPQPPAHQRCRSRTIPCECGDGLPEMPTFKDWLIKQPAAFLKDAMGATLAGKVLAGRLKAADITDFSQLPPLSPDDFEGKVNMLTT